jgi:SAM-dependent methyltransferase
MARRWSHRHAGLACPANQFGRCICGAACPAASAHAKQRPDCREDEGARRRTPAVSAGRRNPPNRSSRERPLEKSANENSAVARQYEKWVYPFPIADLDAPEIRNKRDGGDFARNWHTFWPDQPPREDLDVLVAGCGSNAAARYAFNHPKARVTGVDLSSSSLAHEAHLKDKHDLRNLTLHQGRIEDVSSLDRDFDFIDVSGVLHHLPDPVAGLKALGGVLRPDGTIAVMLYGQYGRTGVYMLQNMFRLMGLGQSEQDVVTVKQTLASLPKRHVIHDYMSRAPDLKYDAGLVDSFLHRQDRAYTVSQCLEFAAQAGMSFMHWWENILYYPEGQLNADHDVYKKVSAMPEESIWQFMELYNGTLGQHAFCVCHASRLEKSYRIGFSADAFMDYVPVLRCVQVKPEKPVPQGCVVVRRQPRPAYTLNPATSALFQYIDGKRSIRECFAASGLETKDAETICRASFRYLWRLSYIFLCIPS